MKQCSSEKSFSNHTISKINILILTLIFIFISYFIYPLSSEAASNPNYILIQLENTDALSLKNLNLCEIFSVHDAIANSSRYRAICNNYEMDKIIKSGIKYSIVASDAEKYFALNLNNYYKATQLQVLDSNFKYGSMAGNFTLDEIYQTFDSLLNVFSGFSKKEEIGSTCEKRKMYAYNFGVNNGKNPEILFVSLQHAREPLSVTILINFFCDLARKYKANDPEAVYLINRRSISVIPCANPDGYYFNQFNYPNGGGLWRKNRKKLNDTDYGVDLNRNYGPDENWNAPNPDGSSTDQKSDIYRGPSPFSEPENQALRDFVLKHKFRIAMNYHTYQNVLIYPYSYKRRETADSAVYRYLAAYLTNDTKYCFGVDSAQVGYAARGVLNDWLCMPDVNKEKTVAMTFEAGSSTDGFWPSPARIKPICDNFLKANYEIVWSAESNFHPYQVYTKYDPISRSALIICKMTNLGVYPNGELSSYSINSLTPEIKIINPKRVLKPLVSAEFQIDTFKVPLNYDLPNGGKYLFEIVINQENILRADTVELQLFKPDIVPLYTSPMEFKNWTGSPWGVQKDNIGTDTVLCDSPDSYYQSSANNFTQLEFPIKIVKPFPATLEFETHWSIERNYDVVYLEYKSSIDSNWKPLRSPRMALLTDGGNGSSQKYGTYGFHGNYPLWLKQEISLDSLNDGDYYIRFHLLSDKNNNYDGIFLKNVIYKTYYIIDKVSDSRLQCGFRIISQNGNYHIISENDDQISNIDIFNSLGERLISTNVNNQNYADIDSEQINETIFFIRIKTISGYYILKFIKI
ncbi:MAG: M14 family zinc carboxypeptidase [Candidatus Kapabacteria bacterium]|nr:M14 family zinc carboxypeptidase [Candidatus Kapabacteria bacterium]